MQRNILKPDYHESRRGNDGAITALAELFKRSRPHRLFDDMRRYVFSEIDRDRLVSLVVYDVALLKTALIALVVKYRKVAPAAFVF